MKRILIAMALAAITFNVSATETAPLSAWGLIKNGGYRGAPCFVNGTEVRGQAARHARSRDKCDDPTPEAETTEPPQTENRIVCDDNGCVYLRPTSKESDL